VFSIVITEKGGAQHQLDLESSEIGIGRLEDNDVCLPKTNVSKHHARLLFKDHRYVVVDQKSTNGTFVNGRRITGPTVLRRGDKIYIGDFILTLSAAATAPAPVAKSVAAREFSPLPPKPDPQPTVPAGHVSALPPELKRTKPERRVGSEVGSSAPAPTHLSSPLPPPLPRSVPATPPPPLPRSSPPAAASANTQAQRGMGSDDRTQRPASSPRSPTRNAAPNPPPSAAPGSRSSAPHNNNSLPGDRTSSVPAPPMPSIPPLPVPQLLESSVVDGVDSAQAAALSGLTSPAVLAPSVRLQGALSLLMERLATHMNVARSEESAFPSEQQSVIERLLDQLAEEGTLGPEIDRLFLREAAISEAVGLGPLDRLLANRAVREIVVDGPTRVLADLGGGLTPVSAFFSDDSAVLVVARRLLHRAGQKLVAEQMVHEAQLPGGGMFQLLMPPLSPKGALISVRCPMRSQNSPESFVTDGVLTADMLTVLRTGLLQRKNVLVFGAVGAGVSNLLAMLTRLVPEHERIVTIEHTPSASLLNPQVLPLSRRAMPDAKLSELLRRAALLRYDRLLLDDLRPEEIWSALFAAAGSGGVLLGMHAPTPTVALSLIEHGARSEMGVSSAGIPAPLMAAAIQYLVHVGPDTGGARRILNLSELRTTAAGALEVRTLFRHDGKAFVASFLGR
jgi:pilus assembly protein CpaF